MLSSAQGSQSFGLQNGSTATLDQLGTGLANAVTGVNYLAAPKPSASATCCAGSQSGVDANDTRTPTTYSYNFTIDQQLPWKMLLETAYVGSQTTNVLIGGGNGATLTSGNDYININKMPLGALFSADPVTGVISPNPENIGGPGSVNNKDADYRPYGNVYGSSGVYVLTHRGYSNYNGLQISLVKRSNHLTFNLNYTHSKTLGTDLSENPFSLRGNYGVEGYDRPNVVNTSATYNVLNAYHGGNRWIAGAINNWLISTITTWQGGGNLQALDSPNFNMALTYNTVNGQPISAANPLPAGVSPGYGSATYYGTTASMTVQPVMTCNPGSGLATNQHVKGNCFTPPAIGSYGPRNFPYLSGPSYTDTDLAIAKTFPIIGSQSFTFRASAFNWDNHPLAAFSNSNQLALKYYADYTSKAITVNPSTSSTYGFTDTKAGGDTRRIIELDARYNF